MTPIKPTARFLMCRPEHFAVSYAINPWMDPPAWARDGSTAASQREWNGLYRQLTELGAAVDLVPPVAGVPDLVFTANAAVVLDRKVLLARFRHPERQAEEPHFERAFQALQGARPGRYGAQAARRRRARRRRRLRVRPDPQHVLARLRPALRRGRTPRGRGACSASR